MPAASAFMARWSVVRRHAKIKLNRGRAGQNAAMDEIDRAILRELVRNGRASHRRLGAVAGLSANAAAERMRRLVRSGAIAGFTAVVDHAAAGRGLSALVDVRLAREQTNDGFERALGRVEGIVYAAHVTGGFDYHLQVACRDTAELDALLRTLKRELGVEHTETRVVLKTAAVR
jgi:Lrp/AsnC family transcriptional regulator, leucine-responsive regulatory protein